MAKSIPKVSGMDWIVDNFSQSAIEPDEFTARMVADKAKTSLASVRCKLERMFNAGEVTRRKIVEDGHQINAYKRVIVTG
jgi:predicted RNA-binding protein with PUA domain